MSFKANFSSDSANSSARFNPGGTGATFSPKFSSGNPGGSGGGENGATFYPSVTENGDLSWSNDKGLENPAPVNIKGPKGDTPQKGADYFTEIDKQELVNELVSKAPVKSVNGKTGAVKLSADDVGALPNTTDIPTALADLLTDATHRVVTDTEKQAWNNKSEFSGKYSDLTGKPDIPTVPSKISAFENDKGYLTEHQDLSAYAKKTDIPTVPTKTSQLTNDSGFLTQHQSLSGYAKTADHYTKTESDNKYQPKGNYLTQHQDISGKADKTGLSLGIASDGLIYLFVDGVPVGTGIPQGQSGDVFGYVDENNTIVLQGTLAEENYTIKYEKEDGTIIDIGELELEAKPQYTNLATTFATGRLNSSGTVDASTTAATTVEDYIQFNPNDVVRIKGLTLGGYNVAIYTSSKAVSNSSKPTFPQTNTYFDCEQESNGVYKFTSKFSTNAFIRFSGVLVGSTSDIVITLNEPIE